MKRRYLAAWGLLSATTWIGCGDSAASQPSDDAGGVSDGALAGDAGGDAAPGGEGGVGDGSATGEGGTPSLCGSGGSALFCEGFEGALGSEWQVYNGTFNNGCGGHSVGLGQRDTTRMHSGTASWHANVNYIDTGSCQAELRRSVTLPMPDTFVRMFVYLPAATVPSIKNTVELNMFVESHQFGAIGPTLIGGSLGAEAYGDVTATNIKDASPFPTDRWVCVEWQLHQGSAATFTAWRDGVQAIAPSAILMPSLAEPLNGLFFGIYGYNNLGPVDVWFDDVALSATRIGCTAQ